MCIGCGRMLDEIKDWTKYDESVKRKICEESSRRLAE